MSQPHRTKPVQRRCGLCGKTKNLTRAPCCGNWVCDDEHKYVLFSYARNSCSRNHRRFTLCGFHYTEGHPGHWKDCQLCRDAFPTELYVWCGTNEYNFEVLENPPTYEPTRCDRCGLVIKLGTDSYSIGPAGTLCERCTEETFDLWPPGPARLIRSGKTKPRLPTNPDPNAIEMILSAQVQKRWHIKPVVRANQRPAHWLAQWRVDFAQKSDRTWVALVTNVATLYTFVFGLNELEGSSRFEELFRLRLGFALLDVLALAHWKDAPIVFAVGNPRSAIGAMNDMRRNLAGPIPYAPGCPVLSDEDRINLAPYAGLPTHLPCEESAQRLKKATRSHAQPE